jgi:hypothetical protein
VTTAVRRSTYDKSPVVQVGTAEQIAVLERTLDRRRRRSPREFDGIHHFGLGALDELCLAVLVQHAMVAEVVSEPRNWILPSHCRHLQGWPHFTDLAGVLAETRDTRLDERRTFACAGGVDCLAHNPIHL